MIDIVEPKYQCEKCNRFEAVYDFKEHQYKCNFCDHVKKMTYKIVRCPNCNSYISIYNYIDPGRCIYCGYSYTE